MNLLQDGRVWCDTSIESCQLWLRERDASPGRICRELLARSERFAMHAQPEVVDILAFMVQRGISMLRTGDVDVYAISPVRAEGFDWIPESNRLTIQAVAALWTLVSDRARGDVSPLLYSEVPRCYYHSVLGRFVEADLARSMNDWRKMTREAAEPRISQAVIRSFQKVSQLLPIEQYQDRIRERLEEGLESGEVYREMSRDLMENGERLVRHLLPDPVSVR